MPVEQWASEIDYWEIHGALEPSIRRPPARNVVVLSNISHGEQTSPGTHGVTIRYVARGCENYRIGGRGCRLEAGQVMIAPHHGGADCEVRRVDQSGTLGVCTLVRGTPEELTWLQGPLVFGARNSTLNALMSRGTSALHAAQRPKLDVARTLIAALKMELPGIARNVLDQAAAVTGAKASTRFETVRRANLAKDYLDSNPGRAIELVEVALVAGISPFRLLAAFQQCFRETPASYHRKLRLRLALEEARRRRVPISAVVDEFGFACVSSFSHAYRRAFGRAPVWNKPEAG
jgi:AraC-like DNA-binding protein